jgi:hypothetical protein
MQAEDFVAGLEFRFYLQHFKIFVNRFKLLQHTGTNCFLLPKTRLMRKLTLVTFAVLLFSFVNAQFLKRDTYLSGAIRFGTSKKSDEGNINPEQKSFSINFSPSFMKFTTDKKAWGIKTFIYIQQNKTTSPSNVYTSNQNYTGLGIFCQRVHPLG